MVTCQAQECRRRPTNPLLVTLYLTEEQVAELLTPADAVETIERCFERLARGAVENHPRYRLRLEHGALAVMAAADLELGYAGAKVYPASAPAPGSSSCSIAPRRRSSSP